MSRVISHQKLLVSTDGDAGPYVMLPVAQLEDVKTILTKSNVSFWVDSEAISLDGEPEIAVINFGQEGDSETVQKILSDAGL